MIRVLLFAACVCSVARAVTPEWQSTVWHGERAFVSVSSGWKAIVSLDRGRLVHFGSADNDINLLFAPSTRSDSAGWGGHRIWLGPQANWATLWPPPDAWEKSSAESFTNTNGVLRLIMPDSGEGWPRLARTYQWAGARLTCGAEMSGGTRSAQFIQIVQVPKTATVHAVSQPRKDAPRGFVELPAGNISRLTADFAQPPHVTVHGTELVLRHLDVVKKLGFIPQPLIARNSKMTLQMSRVGEKGAVIATPDAGFFTQVYLGGPETFERFIELEQLSPSFSAGADASFSMGLEGGVR